MTPSRVLSRFRPRDNRLIIFDEGSHLYSFLFFSFFLKKKTSFFICSSLFCKTVFVLSPWLFRPFFCFFSQSCDFEQNELTLFSFGSHLMFSKKVFHRFSIFFEVPFLAKKNFFEFLRKFHTKMALTTKWLSGSHCLEIFSCLENPSLQPFKKNVFLSSPSCVFHRSKKVFLKKSHSKNCFLEENKTSFYISSWFLLQLYFEQKLFLFFNCPLIFLRLSCYLFFLFLLVFFWCLFFQMNNRVKKISFEKHIGFVSNIFFWTCFGGGNIFWSKNNHLNFLQKKKP